MSYKCIENHNNIILGCTSGVNIGPLTNITPELATTPIKLGSLTIDGRKLCNSSILINVSGEIFTPLEPPAPNTTLRVLKTCNEVTRQISPTFQPITGVVSVPAAESFFYQICDPSGNEGCCCDCIIYTVEFLLPAITAPFTISINNIFISARKICKEG